VLGNKIDVAGALSEMQLREALGLFLTTGKGSDATQLVSGTRPIEVFMCSIANREGYGAAFQWLGNQLK
jgi:GTP-binding protein SAR1